MIEQTKKTKEGMSLWLLSLILLTTGLLDPRPSDLSEAHKRQVGHFPVAY